MGDSRDKIIVRTSIIGILANIFLASFKAVVGIFAHSIAIILDSVNNLSDVLSSVVTIVGAKLARKKPDKKHPLGYGRVEYLSAMIVSAIIIYVGIAAGIESVKKIITPVTPDYQPISLAVISVAVVVKIILGIYVGKKGREAKSVALIGSGKDALFDAVLSTSVLVSAIVFITTGVNLEAYVGIIITVVIIKAGIELLMETLDDILGKRIETETIAEIKETICSEPEVEGTYDLIMHCYGPDRYVGSAHVEIPDTMTAEEIDMLERRIADNVFEKHGVIMTGIGIYAKNMRDEAVISMREDITHLVMEHEGVLQMHGFFIDKENKEGYLDIIIDYADSNRKNMFEHICLDIREKYPDYNWHITPDIDF